MAVRSARTAVLLCIRETTLDSTNIPWLEVRCNANKVMAGPYRLVRGVLHLVLLSPLLPVDLLLLFVL